MQLECSIDKELGVTIKPVVELSDSDMFKLYLVDIVTLLTSDDTKICKDLESLPHEVNSYTNEENGVVVLEVVDELSDNERSTALDSVLSLVQAEVATIVKDLEDMVSEQMSYLSESRQGFNSLFN